jgi:peptidoglycan/LPS O-acetylase OafA/YrhL
MTNMQLPTRAFWICAIIAAVSAVVSASFSVAALIGEGRQDQYAMYAASRSIALVLAILACIATRSRRGVMALALTMVLVQGFDSLIGLIAHNAGKTYGPLALSVAGLASLIALHREGANRLFPGRPTV